MQSLGQNGIWGQSIGLGTVMVNLGMMLSLGMMLNLGIMFWFKISAEQTTVWFGGKAEISDNGLLGDDAKLRDNASVWGQC